MQSLDIMIFSICIQLYNITVIIQIYMHVLNNYHVMNGNKSGNLVLTTIFSLIGTLLLSFWGNCSWFEWLVTQTNLVEVTCIFDKSSEHAAMKFEQTWLACYPKLITIIHDNRGDLSVLPMLISSACSISNLWQIINKSTVQDICE